LRPARRRCTARPSRRASISRPPSRSNARSPPASRCGCRCKARNRTTIMRVGVPKEIKDSEFRVGLVPSTVRELTANGHTVLVETNAGLGAGLTDADYRAVGAAIAGGAAQVFAEAELIVKVKEPLAVERKQLRRGQMLFTYLHLAADPAQTADLL